jgi:Patatin-like phospholipase
MTQKWLLCGVCSLLVTGCSIKLKSEPMDFACSILDDVTQTYTGARIFDQIQAEGSADLGITTVQTMSTTGDQNAGAMHVDPLLEALQGAANEPEIAASSDGQNVVNLLMLSGGGQWGAFGAGMLNTANDSNQLPDFKVVTGVSTGALQSILVTTGELGLLEEQYKIKDQSDLVIEGGLTDVTSKGSLYDTTPLRKKIDSLLCEDQNCARIASIARSNKRLFIGMVELGTGYFKSVDISRIAKAAFPRNPQNAKNALTPLAARDCITGVAMASAAMPGFFTPVRINGKSYTDGGTRYSVFEANAAQLSDDVKGKTVSIYMLRNGPTVLRHDGVVEAGQPLKKVDADPNIKHVALRAYSTIVNQSEISSIAVMRLARPRGDIRFATADGYLGGGQCPLPEPKKKGGLAPVFDAGFMQCLIKWGGTKATRVGGPWRALCEPGAGSC